MVVKEYSDIFSLFFPPFLLKDQLFDIQFASMEMAPFENTRETTPKGNYLFEQDHFSLKKTQLKMEANMKMAKLLHQKAHKAPRFFLKIMPNSTEHEFFLLINVKMPTTVGILTFLSRKNSILGLSELVKS